MGNMNTLFCTDGNFIATSNICLEISENGDDICVVRGPVAASLCKIPSSGIDSALLQHFTVTLNKNSHFCAILNALVYMSFPWLHDRWLSFFLSFFFFFYIKDSRANVWMARKASPGCDYSHTNSLSDQRTSLCLLWLLYRLALWDASVFINPSLNLENPVIPAEIPCKTLRNTPKFWRAGISWMHLFN